MKLLLLVLFAASCFAQPQIIWLVSFTDPTGLSCQFGTGDIYATTRQLFTCQSGVFAAVTAGGTVPSFPLTPVNGGVGGNINVPPQLRYLGDGSDGAINCSGNTSGIKYATTFTVAFGRHARPRWRMLPSSSMRQELAPSRETLNSRGADGGVGPAIIGDGPTGGGGGGGTAGGNAGSASGNFVGTAMIAGGSAGTSAGGAGGGNGVVPNANFQRAQWERASGLYIGGTAGGNGGTGAAAGGKGGQAVIFICASINFAATGVIDVSGAVGTNSGNNNQGSGGGGAAGYVWLIGRDSVVNLGTITATGGAGGTCGAFTGCGAGGKGADGWSKVAVMQ